jgi:hypothetical protein
MYADVAQSQSKGRQGISERMGSAPDQTLSPLLWVNDLGQFRLVAIGFCILNSLLIVLGTFDSYILESGRNGI